MEENTLQDKVEKIKQDTAELDGQIETEKLLSDNSSEFDLEGVVYRVNKPSFEQKQTVNKERMKKLVSLLKDQEQLLEKDLIALYESRGISIAELDTSLDALRKRREDFAEKLGKGLVEKRDEKDLEIYKKEIEKVIVEQDALLMQKSALLDSSIESQINVFVYTYLAYLTLEKRVEEDWVKAFDTYENFLKSDETLVNKATWVTTFVNRTEVPVA